MFSLQQPSYYIFEDENDITRGFSNLSIYTSFLALGSG